MIKLVSDTISHQDIDDLADWLKTYPRLTKGELTKQFEQQYSEWLGCKYSIFVNSGSSANLLMVYALMLSQKLRNKKVVVPAISWATTVSPIIQLGLEPIICDVELDNLGVDLNTLEEIFKKHNPSALMLVHVLGFPARMKDVLKLCDEYNVVLLEDSCETMGSTVNGVKTGNFGLMSSFSFYFSHLISTVEGGMICTNSKKLYNLLVMARSHGWSRDLDNISGKYLKDTYKYNEFESLYKFFIPGFNLRNTEIGAFLGLKQMEKVDDFINLRNKNFISYQLNIENDYWKILPILEDIDDIISNFAYPIMHPKRNQIVKALKKNHIECRPLVCGNMGSQPFIKERGYIVYDHNAKQIDKYGLYVPNYPDLKHEQIKFICDIINKEIA